MNSIIKQKNIIRYIIIFLCALFFVPALSYAQVYFVKAGGERAIYIPSNFVVNSPLPPIVRKYVPGEEIYFQADFWSRVSNGSLRDVNVRITRPLRTEDVYENHWQSWNLLRTQDRVNNYSQHTIPWATAIPVVLPEEVGVYRIYFEVSSVVRWTVGQEYENTYVGYVEVEVAEPVIPESVGIMDDNGIEIQAEISE